MKYLVILSTLFVIGSLFGWTLEVLFRKVVSQKKWMNPGFLTGPYLPIYGCGVAALYGVSNISLGIESQVLDVVVKIAVIGISMTLIEFVTGLIFIKGCKIKLWDYSDRKGNIMGIICPIFSLAWLVVGSLYYFFINPILIQGIAWISENLIYTYLVGAIIGAIIVDFAYSVHLATKLKEFTKLQGLRFEEFKRKFRLERVRNNLSIIS